MAEIGFSRDNMHQGHTVPYESMGKDNGVTAFNGGGGSAGGGGDDGIKRVAAPPVTVTAQGPAGVKVTNRPERIDDPYDKGTVYSQGDISGFEKEAAHQLVKEGKLKNYNAGSDHFGPNYSMIQDRVRQNIGGTTARDFNNYTATDRATGQSSKEINMDPNGQPYNPEHLNQAAGMMSQSGTFNQQQGANSYLNSQGISTANAPQAQIPELKKKMNLAPAMPTKQ